MKKNSDIMPGSSSVSPSKSLYLARDILGAKFRFSLRQTFPDESRLLRHREIFDLGGNPQQFIVYLGDHGYCVDDRVTDAIEPFIIGDAGEMVEKLLWPFVRPDIRAKLEPFMNRGSYSKPLSPVTQAEKEAIDREIHLFDRRRLHYLFYGAIDQSGLYRMPDKLCRKLLGKSRDEKEQYFVASEQVFYADQVKEYLFTIFNLQQHFKESFARIMPQALNQDQLDTFFVDELCRLSRDTSFWQGMEAAEGLPPYLIRYLIMFFDYDFSASQAINDYIKQFMNSHRQFRFPKKKSRMSTEKASEIFGEPADKLAKLSKKELTKLYRKKAKKLHPDTGGEHEEFVRLTEAFEQLRRRS